ncbi:DUF881 domain-containing protein [Salinibacillus xinjiangensis]|uniref:DUF881 domain-containing protein n=1 Tax=Salinibacillus xinjiangensis TaxID=1229268 RepID=A0A6G1X3J2_9BACI|nr:DUF881 domain-containing protein [Salinibacillus xinjiangensis]MRG85489.1 DUF881 domain-containing protein [Salinibacillus xinjiangensis]
MKLKGKHVIFSFILFITGFLVAFSYQLTSEESKIVRMNEEQLQEDIKYRESLNQVEQKNKELRAELLELKDGIRSFEEKLGNQEDLVSTYLDEKKELEMVTGEVPIQGPGVTITLNDANYIPSEDNVNDYIVHDLHVHLVVNELLSSGANAISINGQRLLKNSHIACIGPVISVDGEQHPAPFVISAIGDPEVLNASFELQNGVLDVLVSDNVEVTVEKKDQIKMDARVSGE